MPGASVNYGLLRYLNRDERVTEKLRDMRPAEISFLYLGQIDQGLPESTPFTAARESAGPTMSPRAKRSHLLTVNGFVVAGQLHLDWTYSEKTYRRSTIEKLVEAYRHSLRELIAHCLNVASGTFTPSDFPDAELSQDDLDELLAEFSQMGE
jgi:non-ribosomal peptide synthase protein (TIGR01720 family)